MSVDENKLSVIVPVYKIKEEYLRNCIESLLNQGRVDYEIVLIDDGSPDNCGAICDEYADDIRVRVIHQENQGVSVARNNGIKAATTKWLTFVDADDWVEPSYIDEIYGAISDKGKDAELVMFEYSREFREANSYEYMKEESVFLTTDELETVRKATYYKLLLNGKPNPYTVIALWNKVYRTELFKQYDIWFVPEARKGQDRLLNADVLNSISSIYYFHKMLYRYRCWEDSRTNRYDPSVPKLTAIEIESLQNIIRKHKLEDSASEYLKCRICTRLYACMRLYYFHRNNEKQIGERISDVQKMVNVEPYKSALETVDMSLLNMQEKVFVFFMKYHCYHVVYGLVKAKSDITRKKLS